MSSKYRQYFKLAVENVTEYGDTDIFPYPIDNLMFFDKKTEIVDLLEELHKNFNAHLDEFTVNQDRALQTVGYYGYRWGTQIEPLWNAYFLALVISVAGDIEASRIPVQENCVFSYRYKLDKKNSSLFDKSYDWKTFRDHAVEKARGKAYVLKCDISDFYPRIYHHRIDNALRKATDNSDAVSKIVELLSRFSKNVSYGLPVGGAASRLLSELLLNRVDKLLRSAKIEFCRYADDYLIFSESLEGAYESLIYLSEKLHENEGLLIQKSKTQIMSSDEFLTGSGFVVEHEQKGLSPEDKEELNFLKLRLFYDPYSPTADSDYEDLKNELRKFDIIGMLSREVNKSRINQALTKRLISSVKYLDKQAKKSAALSLIDNFKVLYPVFPSVILLLKSSLNDLDDVTKNAVFQSVRVLFTEDSYIVKVSINMSFAVRLLAYDKSDESDQILTDVFTHVPNDFIKRDVIVAMAMKNADYWVSDTLKHYSSLTDWEKRSLLVASYILGDEGSHWRDKVKSGLSPYDKIVLNWFSSRSQNKTCWGDLL